MNNNIYRGDVYYCDLKGATGCEQQGIRPVVVIQNNIGNFFSKTIIVAPLTTKSKKNLPTHINITSIEQIKNISLLLLEQIRTVDKERLCEYVGSISKDELLKVENAIKISLGIV